MLEIDIHERIILCIEECKKQGILKTSEYKELLGYLDEWFAEIQKRLTNDSETLKDLEEAANHYASVTDPEAHGIDFISEVFIAGAEWQEKQMMKGAVEGEIFDDYDKDTCEHHLTILSTVPSGYKDGDKVRVIIIPYTDGNE